MGWTWTQAKYCKCGVVNRKAECDELYNCGYLKVIRSAMVGSTYYAAVKRIKRGDVELPEDEQIVFAAICLTKTNSKSYYDFGYKDMDETEGPYESKCPESILRLLSPTTSEYAQAWRTRCWENVRKKKEGISLSSLPVGSVISFGTVTLIKHSPYYQFKRPFWKYINENHYMPTKRIPDDFNLLYVGDGTVCYNWEELKGAKI